MEADDALADHVPTFVALAPPVVVRSFSVAEAERRDVVGERVEPDVDHLRRISRHLDAPALRTFPRARNADVVEPGLDEGQHFVPPVLGLDAQPTSLDQVEELVLIARQAEEPVALDDQLRRLVVLRAKAVMQVAGMDERLAARAVEPLVVALVEITACGTRGPKALDAGTVSRIGARADEVVSRQLQQGGEIDEPLRLLRDELRHRQTRGECGIDVLERIVVRAAQEAHVVATEPAVPRNDVCLNEFQRVAEMRIAVHIGNGGRDVGAALGAHRFLPSGPTRGQLPMSASGPASCGAGLIDGRTSARRQALAAGPSSEPDVRARTCSEDSARSREHESSPASNLT